MTLYFTIEGNCLSKQTSPRGLEELIRGLSLLGFDPNSLVNRRVEAIMSTMHKQNVNPGLNQRFHTADSRICW